MKIKLFRGLLLGFLFIIDILGIYFSIEIFRQNIGVELDSPSYALNLVGCIAIVALDSFEIYRNFRAISRGTQILGALCLDDNREVNKGIGVTAIVLTSLSFVSTIRFTTVIAGINTLTSGKLGIFDYYFLLLLSLFVFANFGFMTIYCYLLAKDDLVNFKNR
jgi:hypothetical protein